MIHIKNYRPYNWESYVLGRLLYTHFAYNRRLLGSSIMSLLPTVPEFQNTSYLAFQNLLSMGWCVCFTNFCLFWILFLAMMGFLHFAFLRENFLHTNMIIRIQIYNVLQNWSVYINSDLISWLANYFCTQNPQKLKTKAIAIIKTLWICILHTAHELSNVVYIWIL